MTLKQRKLIKHLSDSDSVFAAAKKAGYKMDKGSRTIYRQGTMKHIRDALNKAHLSLDDLTILHKDLVDLAIANNDLANASRNVENLVKMQGGYTDKLISKADVTLNEHTPSLIDSIRSRYTTHIDPSLYGNEGQNAVDNG